MKDHHSTSEGVDPELDQHITAAIASMLRDAPHAESTPRDPAAIGITTQPARRARTTLLAAATLVAVVGVGGLFLLPPRGTDTDYIVPTESNAPSDAERPATTLGSDPAVPPTLSGTEPPATTAGADSAVQPTTPASAGLEETIANAVGLVKLDLPSWFATREIAPSCGAWINETAGRSNDQTPLDCFSAAIANDERAQIVTVHSGNGLRVARWIVTLGTGPVEQERFAVDSLVVDERTGTTRWFETRCVEGFFVDGRLVGGFVVGRDQLDQLDPSGTIVTDDGEVLDLPEPDDRMQLQPCSDPSDVVRPVVTPLDATGLRIGDDGSSTGVPGSNEVGEYDLTVVPSWTPVGEDGTVVGFVRTDMLAPPPPPTAEGSISTLVIYADDGSTRLGQFGRDGRPTLDG